jgi:hypothetical protein
VNRFDEAPKLDSGLGSGTVPVIAIPLAFRGAASQLQFHSDKARRKWERRLGCTALSEKVGFA